MSTSAKRKVSSILDTLTSNDDGEDETALSLTKRPRHVLAKLSMVVNKRRKEEALHNSTYAPWSRELFLTRLSTYQYRNWSLPDNLKKISALECCKRGWKALPVSEHAQQNTIQCVHCLALLNINVGTDEEVQKKMEHYFSELLVTKHAESCPWKQKGSDDAVYILPLTNGQRQEFHKRYRVLSTNDQIDNYEYSCTPALTANMLEKVSMEDTLNVNAAKLALLGWAEDSKIGNTTLVSCSLCFRKLPLNRDFDLDGEHMSYCPYIQIHEGKVQWLNLYDLIKSAEPKSKIFLKSDATLDDEEQRKSRLANLKRIYFRH